MLQICLDPKDRNKAIKCHHFHLPTTEERFASMSNTRLFTKLDASNAYWQIEVDEKSPTNTPFGCFSFKQLPFGIHSASKIWQLKISHSLEGIEGVHNSQDDIMIWGLNKDELLAHTTKALESIRSAGLKLNKGKCKFVVKSTSFLGHKMSAEGVEADPSKIQVILNMPEPTSKMVLQCFLGMITYAGKFIHNDSDLTAPPQSLIKKDIIYSFDKGQKEVFKTLKTIITSSPVLKFFDPALPICIQAPHPVICKSIHDTI